MPQAEWNADPFVAIATCVGDPPALVDEEHAQIPDPKFKVSFEMWNVVQ